MREPSTVKLTLIVCDHPVAIDNGAINVAVPSLLSNQAGSVRVRPAGI